MSDTPHSCCTKNEAEKPPEQPSCCDSDKASIDWLLWICFSLSTIFYISSFFITAHQGSYSIISHSVTELINTMWWSVLLAIFFVGILSKTPQHFILSILGQGGTFKGLWRATFAGVLLDLCSHGILMVGMELRKKGASLGQVMAFLIASPWNSISLTIIMFSLIGLEWTLAFIVLSMLLAITTGWLFDYFEQNGTLPKSHVDISLPENFQFFRALKEELRQVDWNKKLAGSILKDGLSGSKMVIRWLLFGVLLASAIRAFVPLDDFQTYFGPTLLGLGATLIAATIIEVCSEGSTPIAADLLTRAEAPGNSFAFLMTGVATDYTEVMVIKDTMKSWKVALFLPLLTVPQVILVALILNNLY
ncbi:MAG: permease [Oleiphilus sp.]